MRIRKSVGNQRRQAQIMVRFRISFLVFLVAQLSAAQDDACDAHVGLNWQNVSQELGRVFYFASPLTVDLLLVY